jgi:hypothetical protein
MNAIEKDLYWCNEGCGFVDKNHRCEQWCNISIIPAGAIKALAAPEAEKPAEDVDGLAGDLLAIFANGGSVGYVLSKITNRLQSFAQSYHEKQCAEPKTSREVSAILADYTMTNINRFSREEAKALGAVQAILVRETAREEKEQEDAFLG